MAVRTRNRRSWKMRGVGGEAGDAGEIMTEEKEDNNADDLDLDLLSIEGRVWVFGSVTPIDFRGLNAMRFYNAGVSFYSSFPAAARSNWRRRGHGVGKESRSHQPHTNCMRVRSAHFRKCIWRFWHGHFLHPSATIEGPTQGRM